MTDNLYTRLKRLLDELANKVSQRLPLTGGTLTGPTYAPTPDSSDNSARIATTEFVKNASSSIKEEIENDIESVSTALNNKADKDLSNVSCNIRYVVATWRSGANWYRKWSDGWIEQGGIKTISSKSAAVQITLNQAMANTNYIPLFSIDNSTGSSASTGQVGVYSKTTTSFYVRTILSDGSAVSSLNRSWYVAGWGAT